MSPRAQTSPPSSPSARSGASPTYRLRPAARRGGPGGGSSRIRWDRLGRLVLVLAFVLLICVHAAPDVVRWFQAREVSEQQHLELRALQEENRELKERSAELDTPAAAERQARERGMVASGELSYVIVR